MLGKLIKLDFRMLRLPLKWVISIYSLLLASAFVVRSFNIPVIGVLAFGIAVFATFVFVPVVFILLVSHYYRHFYTNQGYLTHTLPVTSSQRYHAKFVSGFILYVFSTMIAVVGWFLVLLMDGVSKGHALVRIDEFLTFAGTWHTLVGLNAWTGYLLIVCLWLAIYLSFFATMSFSITVGTGRRFGRFGGGGPFLVYIILNVVNQIVGLLGFLFIPLSLRISAGFSGPQIRLVTEMPFRNIIRIGITGRNIPLMEVIERGGGYFDLGLGVYFVALVFIVFSYFFTKRQVGKVNLR